MIENNLTNLEDKSQNRKIVNQIERLNSQNVKARPARHSGERQRVQTHVQLRGPRGPGTHTLAPDDVAQLNDLVFIDDSIRRKSADTVRVNLRGEHLVLTDREHRQGYR